MKTAAEATTRFQMAPGDTTVGSRPTEALRERLDKIERRNARASVEELLMIADRAAAHVKGPYLDHAELLYDEHGLPK